MNSISTPNAQVSGVVYAIGVIKVPGSHTTVSKSARKLLLRQQRQKITKCPRWITGTHTRRSRSAQRTHRLQSLVRCSGSKRRQNRRGCNLFCRGRPSHHHRRVEAIDSYQNVTFRPGDVLLIRTGATEFLANPSKADFAKMAQGKITGVHGSAETARWF